MSSWLAVGAAAGVGVLLGGLALAIQVEAEHFEAGLVAW